MDQTQKTYTVRRRKGDHFDGQTGLNVELAVDRLNYLINVTDVPVETTVQLLDETTDSAVVTFKKLDDGWSVV